MVEFFYFKQKTAYDVRISDWSSDVCSSDLRSGLRPRRAFRRKEPSGGVASTYGARVRVCSVLPGRNGVGLPCTQSSWPAPQNGDSGWPLWPPGMWAMPSASWPGDTTMRSDAPNLGAATRSEEHTSELQSLMR